MDLIQKVMGVGKGAAGDFKSEESVDEASSAAVDDAAEQREEEEEEEEDEIAKMEKEVRKSKRKMKNEFWMSLCKCTGAATWAHCASLVNLH